MVLHSPNQLAAAAVSPRCVLVIPMVQFNLPDLSSPAETQGPDSGCQTTGHGHAHCVNVGGLPVSLHVHCAYSKYEVGVRTRKRMLDVDGAVLRSVVSLFVPRDRRAEMHNGRKR